jgi:hypothetical protein
VKYHIRPGSVHCDKSRGGSETGRKLKPPSMAIWFALKNDRA